MSRLEEKYELGNGLLWMLLLSLNVTILLMNSLYLILTALIMSTKLLGCITLKNVGFPTELKIIWINPPLD